MKCTTQNSIKEVQKNHQIAEDKKRERNKTCMLLLLSKGHKQREIKSKGIQLHTFTHQNQSLGNKTTDYIVTSRSKRNQAKISQTFN